MQDRVELRPGLPADLPTLVKTHQIDLTLASTHTQVRISGEVDCRACNDLRALMSSLPVVTTPIYVDLTGVTFLDSSGIDPLVQADRQRCQQGHSRLEIGDRSRQAQFFLDVAGLGGRPHLDVEAWTRLSEAVLSDPHYVLLTASASALAT